MKTEISEFKKKNYQQPTIEVVKIDSEISLILGSEPPIFPGEGYNVSTTVEDPFKMNQA